MFVYDLMKTDWESRVPHVEAIELNIDIIMSSSPLYTTSQSLLNLIRVEKARKESSTIIIHVEIRILNVSFAYVIILIVQELLKHKHFRGQLNVTIRFAHPYGWDAKDPIVKEEIHTG